MASVRSVCLLAFLPSVDLCSAAADGELEKPNLLLLTFSCARDVLVAERGQRPALRGFDGHGIDLDSAKASC